MSAAKEKGGKNSRKNQRISMRLPCRLILDKPPATTSKSSPPKTSFYIVNLSSSGMRLSGDMPMVKDVPLNASITLEDEGGRVIHCRFKVKWLSKNSFKAYGGYSYGLEITSMSADDREFLSKIFRREKENLAARQKDSN